MAERYRTIPLFSPFAGLVAVESLRQGGNLGLHTDDDPAVVRSNRAQLCADLNITPDQLIGSHQVHGDDILVVEQKGYFEGYDGLISDRKGLFLSVTVADCMPLLLFDAQKQVIAAVHAGWRGTVAGIARKCLSMMQNHYGSRPSECYAWLGTCIDECSFETDADVADRFSADFKRWDEQRQKYLIDLKKANQAQLAEAGIPPSQMALSPYSTVLHNENYFSYRKEAGQTGRMLAVIGIVG